MVEKQKSYSIFEQFKINPKQLIANLVYRLYTKLDRTRVVESEEKKKLVVKEVLEKNKPLSTFGTRTNEEFFVQEKYRNRIYSLPESTSVSRRNEILERKIMVLSVETSTQEVNRIRRCRRMGLDDSTQEAQLDLITRERYETSILTIIDKDLSESNLDSFSKIVEMGLELTQASYKFFLSIEQIRILKLDPNTDPIQASHIQVCRELGVSEDSSKEDVRRIREARYYSLGDDATTQQIESFESDLLEKQTSWRTVYDDVMIRNVYPSADSQWYVIINTELESKGLPKI